MFFMIVLSSTFIFGAEYQEGLEISSIVHQRNIPPRPFAFMAEGLSLYYLIATNNEMGEYAANQSSRIYDRPPATPAQVVLQRVYCATMAIVAAENLLASQQPIVPFGATVEEFLRIGPAARQPTFERLEVLHVQDVLTRSRAVLLELT